MRRFALLSRWPRWVLLGLLSMFLWWPVTSWACTSDRNCNENYYCGNYKVNPSTGQSVGQCICRWGAFEAGFIDLEGNFVRNQNSDICDFLDTIEGSGREPLPYVANLFVIAITVLVIMAGAVSIVIGGYIYMTGGGNAARVQQAKVWIGAALLGITLALLAWVLLYAISPSLV